MPHSGGSGYELLLLVWSFEASFTYYILHCVFLLSNALLDIFCCSIASCGNLCMPSIYAPVFRVCHKRNKKENRMWWWRWFLFYLYWHSQLRPCRHPPFWTIPFLHKYDGALFGAPSSCFFDMLNCSTIHCDICTE